MTTFHSVEDAALAVTTGATLALGGMTLYRRPVGFVRALLKSPEPATNLTLIAFTAGYAADLLIGAGRIGTLRCCYMGLEAFGFAPMFTEFANQGKLNILEESEVSIVMGLRAAVGGTNFLPSTAWQGTDMLALRPDVKTIEDPYTGELLTAFPAIHVDVAVIHALVADHEGNIAINRNLAIDQLLVYAADTVIVTVEQIVDRIHPTPDLVMIPAAGIDVICHLPDGARPTSCYPLYPMQGRVFSEYVELCAAGSFSDYLAGFIAGDSPL
jgi:glutaconate CoA-transferase subunit A